METVLVETVEELLKLKGEKLMITNSSGSAMKGHVLKEVVDEQDPEKKAAEIAYDKSGKYAATTQIVREVDLKNESFSFARISKEIV